MNNTKTAESNSQKPKKDVVVRMKKDIVVRKEQKKYVNPVSRIKSVVSSIPDEEIMVAGSEYFPSYNPSLYKIIVPGTPCGTNSYFFDTHNGHHSIIADPKIEWVSDFLAGECWMPGEFIFLQCNTGTGKTTLVEDLVKYSNYRILILTNRRANRAQIRSHLFITPDSHPFWNADVMSYQTLERNEAMTAEYLDTYDLIVCDEYHYFVSDAQFNSNVNISFNRILNTTKAVKLMMTATIESVKMYTMHQLFFKYGADISAKCRFYALNNSKQHVNSVSCVDWEYLIPKIKTSSDKWLIFTDTIDMGTFLAKEIGEDAVFVDSEKSINEGKAREQFKHLSEHEQFKCRVLIATSVLDNGVNLKDRNLKSIVLESDDKVELVQMLGRKRCIDEKDNFDLFLINKRTADIGKSMGIEMAKKEQYKNCRADLKHRKYVKGIQSVNGPDGDNYRNMTYHDVLNKTFHFNYLAYFGIKRTIDAFKELINSGNIFEKKLQWIFGLAWTNVRIDINSTDLENLWVQRITSAISPYMGRRFSVKDAGWQSFRKAFTKEFWKHFGKDSEENHRPDRLLSVEKICNVINKYKIPVEIVRISIKKKVFYEIKEIHDNKENTQTTQQDKEI